MVASRTNATYHSQSSTKVVPSATTLDNAPRPQSNPNCRQRNATKHGREDNTRWSMRLGVGHIRLRPRCYYFRWRTYTAGHCCECQKKHSRPPQDAERNQRNKVTTRGVKKCGVLEDVTCLHRVAGYQTVVPVKYSVLLSILAVLYSQRRHDPQLYPVYIYTLTGWSKIHF